MKLSTQFKIKKFFYRRNIRGFLLFPFIRLRNFILVKRFPFLKPSCGYYTSMFWHPKGYKYRYEETWLDSLPKAWRKAFGIKLCKELQEVIDRDGLTGYVVEQTKEKFGSLRWYDEGGNDATDAIIDKYEKISTEVCIDCGKKAKFVTHPWISYLCYDCAKKYNGGGINPIKEEKNV